ncbi:MAG: hypothetical protein KGL10_09275 [Alphaproteobacteria bacterium]|nr:hypothetical protein [Alphaproteobacteria bacterium]MDE2337490.1 hypothetical protein [Alphaproteobacteria bacterium]
MADLSTLIRLHKHELDEKRQALAALYAAAAELERRRRELDRSFEREKEMALGSGDVNYTFAGYAQKVRQQQAETDAQKAALERQIEAAKDSMMETFSELKKYEMTQAERDRLEAEERALKETRELDEIGLESFRRKERE